jgi:hypothetical protein
MGRRREDSKNLMKDYEFQVARGDKLEAENKQLKIENKRLKKRIDYLEATFETKLEAMVARAVDTATKPLKEIIVKQEKQLELANIEISRLKTQINKNSSNSSKPPSSDGFKKIKNSRETTTKKQGGQVGHPGRRLCLPENLDQLIADGLVEMKVMDHTNGASDFVSKYKIDTITKVVITEHRFSPNTPLAPEFSNEVSYGNDFKAQTVFFLSEGIIAKQRYADMLNVLTRGTIKLSRGSMENFQHELARKLNENGEIEAITNDLLNAELIHVDDTGSKTTERIVYSKDTDEASYEKSNGTTFNAYLRTYATADTTLYTAHPGKGEDGVIRDGILPNYHGDVACDHESKFRKYGRRYVACHAHLTRELRGIHENYQCEWAKDFRTFILDMKKFRDLDLERDPERCFCPADQFEQFSKRYDELITQGQALIDGKSEATLHGFDDIRKMVNRLHDYKFNYLLFMQDYSLPFTNNTAEVSLRSEKTKQKVSGCFRSWCGLVTNATNRSFFATLKKRGVNLLDATFDAFSSTPILSI